MADRDQGLEWRGTWRRRSPSDPNSPLVGIHEKLAGALQGLLVHYPFIVYLCYVFWRKLLFHESLSPSTDIKIVLRGGMHTGVRTLGAVGAMRKFSSLFLPRVFLQERRPLTLKSLETFGSGEIVGRFLQELVLGNQADCLEALIIELQVDLRDVWQWKGIEETLLHTAIDPDPDGKHRSTSQIVNLLIQCGAPVNNNVPGCTPIHLAAECGFVAAIALLIKAGAHVDPRSSADRTPLGFAAVNGHTEAVRLLLNNEADIRCTNQDHFTLLHAAAYAGAPEMVELLVKGGLSVEAKTNVNDTPLHYAAREGHLDTVKVLLKHRAPVDVEADEGNTPLMDAVEHGQIKVARALLGQGAKASTIRRGGVTLLHAAVTQGHRELIELFLVGEKRWRVPVNQTDTAMGQTALHHAGNHVTLRESRDATEVLLRHGADPSIQDMERRTALHFAAAEGFTETCDLLLRGNRRLVDTPDMYGSTALHYACKYGRLTTVKELLRSGAAVHLANNGAGTPLHVAVANGHLMTVSILLDHGADLWLKDCDGKTPLNIAEDDGRRDIQELLAAQGEAAW